MVRKSAIESISGSSLENINKIDTKEAQETKYKSPCLRNNYKLIYVTKNTSGNLFQYVHNL